MNPLDLKKGNWYLFTPEIEGCSPFKVKFEGVTFSYFNRRKLYAFEDGKGWYIELTNYKVAEKISNL